MSPKTTIALNPKYNSMTDFAELADNYRVDGTYAAACCAVFLAIGLLLDLIIGWARLRRPGDARP